jgi:hypothetical protein
MDSADARSDLVPGAATAVAGMGIITVALFPLAIPILALTIVALLPLALPLVAVVAVAAILKAVGHVIRAAGQVKEREAAQGVAPAITASLKLR